MFQSKNNENIYGYTGKKSPQYNFVSASIQGTYKKTNEFKTKPQIVLKQDKTKDCPVKKLLFINESDEDITLYYIIDKNVNIIPLDFETAWTDILNLPIICKTSTDDDDIHFILNTHEKGISVCINSFELHPEIIVDGELETIIFRKNELDIKVVESKIGFLNTNFPFHYLFEPNRSCDDIFNDFISSHLKEIKPPSTITVPSKQTKSEISFRQYIGYIKTRTFMNFKIDSSGWYIDNFSDTDEVDLPSGVQILPLSFWTYYPRGSRIDHLLQFQ